MDATDQSTQEARTMNDRKSKHRLAALAATLLAVAATAVPAASAERFVPGVTDFGVRSEFTPGVTDFPQRPADVYPEAAPTPIRQVGHVAAADRFDWADAGVGAGAAVVAAFAAAAAAVVVSRTRRVRHG
jgi:hypothetical protein